MIQSLFSFTNFEFLRGLRLILQTHYESRGSTVQGAGIHGTLDLVRRQEGSFNFSPQISSCICFRSFVQADIRTQRPFSTEQRPFVKCVTAEGGIRSEWASVSQSRVGSPAIAFTLAVEAGRGRGNARSELGVAKKHIIRQFVRLGPP